MNWGAVVNWGADMKWGSGVNWGCRHNLEHMVSWGTGVNWVCGCEPVCRCELGGASVNWEVQVRTGVHA